MIKFKIIPPGQIGQVDYKVSRLPNGKTRDVVIHLLRNAPWKEVRPGVLEKTVVYRGQSYSSKHVRCGDCRADWPMLIVLKDSLWKLIAPDEGQFCFKCMEKRLGRKIVAGDLKKKAKGNRDLLYILRSRS